MKIRLEGFGAPLQIVRADKAVVYARAQNSASTVNVYYCGYIAGLTFNGGCESAVHNAYAITCSLRTRGI